MSSWFHTVHQAADSSGDIYTGYNLKTSRVGKQQGYILELKYVSRKYKNMKVTDFIPRYSTPVQIELRVKGLLEGMDYTKGDVDQLIYELKKRVTRHCKECESALVWNTLKSDSLCPVCEWI